MDGPPDGQWWHGKKGQSTRDKEQALGNVPFFSTVPCTLNPEAFSYVLRSAFLSSLASFFFFMLLFI